MDGGGDPIQWGTIFDGAAPLRLLYSLQILVRHLAALRSVQSEGAGANSSSSSSAGSVGDSSEGSDVPPVDLSAPWCAAFVQLGGARHLYSTLLNIDLEGVLGPRAPRLYREAARLLVGVVSALLLGSGGVGGAGERLQLSACAPEASGEGKGEAADGGRRPLAARLLQLLGHVAAHTLERRRGQQQQMDGGDAAALGAGVDVTAAASPSVDATGGHMTGSEGSGAEEDEDGEDGGASPPPPPLVRSPTVVSTVVIIPPPAGGGSGGSPDEAAAPYLSIARCVMDLLPPLLLPSADNRGAPSPSPALDHFLRLAGGDATLAMVLLAPPSPLIRTVVGEGLQRLWRAEEESGGGRLAQWLQCYLLRRLPSVLCYPDACEMYFSSLLTLLKSPPEGSAARPLLCTDPACCGRGYESTGAHSSVKGGDNGGERGVLRALANLLASHPIVEVGSEEADVKDTVLTSLLAVLEAALAGRPPDLVEWAAWGEGDGSSPVAATAPHALTNSSSGGGGSSSSSGGSGSVDASAPPGAVSGIAVIDGVSTGGGANGERHDDAASGGCGGGGGGTGISITGLAACWGSSAPSSSEGRHGAAAATPSARPPPVAFPTTGGGGGDGLSVKLVPYAVPATTAG